MNCGPPRRDSLVYMYQHVENPSPQSPTTVSWLHAVPFPLRKTLPPMRSWFSIRIARWCAVLLTLVMAAVVLWAPTIAAAPKPAPTADTVETNQSWYMVIDRAGILNDGQARSAINDAYRLNLNGIPTQVVTEPVALNQAQADARADELRIIEGIESAPWADDGLVVYVSVDPYDQENVVMSISTGVRTLPRNGLKHETLDGIRDRIVTDQLAQGHPARAIVYSLREMIYLEQYVPPPPSVVTGWRVGLNPMIDVLAPALSMVGIAWLIRGRNHRAAAVGFGTVAVVVLGLAVATRSSPGVLSAAFLGGIVVWGIIRVDRSRERTIVATPRPPGRRVPARLRQVSRP